MEIEDLNEIKTREKRLNRRNSVMVARFFYWTEIRRRRYDDVVCILENNEFFVEYQTISRILSSFDSYYSYLKGMSSNECTRYLKNEYPSWNWT